MSKSLSRNICCLILGLFFWGVPLTGVTANQPVEQISCHKPQTQAHKLICEDPYLTALAIAVAKQYGILKKRLTLQPQEALDQEQAAWTHFRDSDCDTAFNKPFKNPQKEPKRLCLTNHFEQRLVTLENRLRSTGLQSGKENSDLLGEATSLLPSGHYFLTARYKAEAALSFGSELEIEPHKIKLGDEFCIEPTSQIYGVENYTFFRNFYDARHPGEFGWPERASARSLMLAINCSASSPAFPTLFLIGKPGTLGIVAGANGFLVFELNQP